MKFSIKDFIFLKRPEWSFGVFSPIYIKNLGLWYRLWADNARNNKFSIFEEIPQLTRRIMKWNFSKIFQICQFWGIVVLDGIPGCNAPIGFIDALTFLRSVRRCHFLDFFFITKIGEFQGEQDSSLCFNSSCVFISFLSTCNFSFMRGHCSVQMGSSFFQVILIIVLFVKWAVAPTKNVGCISEFAIA